MFRKACCVLFFVLAFTLTKGEALAQTPNFNNDVVVNSIPQSPGPSQPVTLSVQSYTVNLHSATIDWKVDNKLIASGIGLDHFTFTTKAIGAPTNVSVFITPIGSLPITKNIVVTPMSVDILWEATDSITPPLYRGKAMPTTESSLKFVAIPQVKSQAGSYLPASNFVFDWTEDFNPQKSDSGYGIDSYTANMNYLNPTKSVGVTASTPDGSVKTKSDISVDPVSPKILWYASSPLYGPLFDSILTGNYTVSSSDTSLLAEPYFFSPQSETSAPLTYEWKLNGEPLTTPPTPNVLFLHRESDSAGTAEISVSILNPSRLFQEAKSSLSLILQ